MAGDASFANVSLLLHMDGADNSTTFLDSSQPPKIVTAAGGAKVSTAQSKFGGASLLLNGTSDYVSSGATKYSDFAFGTGDFTIEFWVRASSIGSDQTVVCLRDAATAAGNMVRITPAGKIGFSNGAAWRESSGSIAANTWYHVAVTRASGTLRIFVDGVQSFSGSDTTNFSGNRPINIGRRDDGNGYFGGHIDDVRVSNIARYTANFTVPAEAFPDRGPRVVGKITDASGNPASRTVRAYRRDTGALLGSVVPRDTTGDAYRRFVSLMLHMDGANNSTTFTDSRPTPKTVTRIGNAKISTTESKFGGASAYFDGSNDYLQVANSSDLSFGTGDFTFEAWFWQSSAVAGMLWEHANSPASGAAGLYVSVSGSRNVSAGQAFGSEVVASTTAPIVLSQWNHIVVQRSATTWTIYVNGVSVGTGASAVNLTASGPVTIGGHARSASASITGYLDDLRITKGIARYTADFTPPTAPHPDYDNSAALNEYVIETQGYTGEVNVICLDDDAGTLENDLILRTYPE